MGIGRPCKAEKSKRSQNRLDNSKITIERFKKEKRKEMYQKRL